MKLAIVIVVLTACAPAARAEWVDHPAAVQTVYAKGVPHTDRNGRPLDAYDANRSFFPIAIYHALHGEHRGRTYGFGELRKAGFNSCHLWAGHDEAEPAAIRAAADAGVQVIIQSPDDAVVRDFRDHPAILGWYVDEEPTGRYWGDEMAARFAEFGKRRDAIRAIDPSHPVFVLDVPWITEPATEWWTKWATSGDVSVHDNYPINHTRRSLSFNQGIPESVSLAARVNGERKPVWVCLQAFEQNDKRFQFSMPDPRQLRCMTYAAIVHGGTGVMYFALDSWVTRNGSVVGMSPDAPASYGQDLVATADQLRMSRALWEAATAVNKELDALRPALLSPTAAAGVNYQIQLDSEWESITKEPIRTLLKTHPDGGYVLLVVNIDAAPQRVRVVFADPKFKFTQLFEAAGAAQLQTAADGLSFMAGPWDVRVIRITP